MAIFLMINTYIVKIISSILLLSLINCNASKQSSIIAAKDFCNCLNGNKDLGRDSALSYCHSLLENKYRMFKIYMNTRDTFIHSIYSQKTIDSVQDFIAQFAKEVDACNPPFWFKNDSK